MAINVQENINLAPFTTLKIGGDARYFLRAESEDDIAEALIFASTQGMPVFVLGGGSNILVSDGGFEGLVLQIGLKGKDASVNESAIDDEGTPVHIRVSAGAGEDWDAFVAYCVENDLAGIECMSGIPGFVGGTPVQNVGAYGQEVAETIASVQCFDRTENKVTDLSNADCGFTYRTSIFNSSQRDRYIVLGVTYQLQKSGDPKVVYKDLKEHFGERRPSLAEVREAVLNIRRAKSMVIDPGDPNSRSVGSFFKNPIISREKLSQLESDLGRTPNFEFGEDVKVPAAWLIENAGFPKGFILGNAGISSNHTLAIINRGEARAADIVQLKNEIQAGVETKFGIVLQPEPVFVGF